MKLAGENRRTRGETCPSATLSTTNPRWNIPGLNRCLRGERPATKRLSMAQPLGELFVLYNILYMTLYGPILHGLERIHRLLQNPAIGFCFDRFEFSSQHDDRIRCSLCCPSVYLYISENVVCDSNVCCIYYMSVCSHHS